MIGHKLLEPRAPRGVIDGALDRLHLQIRRQAFPRPLGPEGLQPGKRDLNAATTSAATGRPSGARQNAILRPRRSPLAPIPSTKFPCGNPIDHGS